jgi:PAS domain S-box-containing protein
MELAAKKGVAPDPQIDLQAYDSYVDQIRIVDQMDGVWAVIPLIEDGNLLGAMIFAHSEPGWFTKARLAPFQSLANLSLLAIQKVRMVDALKLYANNLEDKVAERTKDLTDITERLAQEVKRTREAQERLSQEKEMLDVTLHSIGESVIVTDVEGMILLANQIAEENGTERGSIIGRWISEVLPIRDPLTDEPEKEYWVAKDQDSVSEHKGMVVRSNGRRDLSYNSAPIRDRSGNAIGYVIVFRDITDDVRMQKALAEAQRLDSIGQLAGGIAHSFNNILTSILGNLEMVGYAKLDPVRRDACLDDAKQSAIKAKDLSNQLLTFAKGGDPIRKNISILNVLRGLSESLPEGSRVNIKAESMNDPYMVNADEVQIGQAFANLMTNALASAPPNVILGVSLSHQDIDNARTRSVAMSRYVVVNLEAPNWISQRSESDPEAQASAMDEKQGLDLAIANSIVRRHDGFMVMDSSAKGSNYKVYLLAWSDGLKVPAIGSKERTDRPAKVLVMDDDEGVLDVLTGMIGIMGHSVVAAKEGGEAIELYSQADASGEPFDVVIMDLNIPGGLGGRETIKRLLESYTNVNAIVSSGYSNDPITANYLSYGFKGVLPKPYTMKQLEEAIQKAMAEL